MELEKSDTHSSGVNIPLPYSKKALEDLCEFWYCPNDNSKYTEHTTRFNSGEFTINLEKLDFSIQQAINIKKLPESSKKNVLDVILIIKNEVNVNSEIKFVSVECPLCNKLTVAPKIPSNCLINEKVRKDQVKTIDSYIKELNRKYFPRRYLSIFTVISIVLLMVILLVIVEFIL